MEPAKIIRRYAGALMARRRKGKIYVLAMKVKKLYGWEAGAEFWQFAGGMEEEADEGKPLKTMMREFREETDLEIIENPEASFPILYEDTPGEGIHRTFYLLWHRNGRGRRRTRIITDGPNEIHPPVWVLVEVVEPKLSPSQKPVLKEFKEKYITGL